MVMLLLKANLPVICMYVVKEPPALVPSLIMTFRGFVQDARLDGHVILIVPRNNSRVALNTAPSGPALNSIELISSVVPDGAAEVSSTLRPTRRPR